MAGPKRPPSTGVCYGCRHVGDDRFSTTGHCLGSGDLEPSPAVGWPGFICACPCRPRPAS